MADDTSELTLTIPELRALGERIGDIFLTAGWAAHHGTHQFTLSVLEEMFDHIEDVAADIIMMVGSKSKAGEQLAHAAAEMAEGDLSDPYEGRWAPLQSY